MSRDWEAESVRALIDLVQDRGNLFVNGRIKFTETQARAILELRLQRLTGLEQDKINGELEALSVDIKKYLLLLGNRDEMLALMLKEFSDIKEEFATPRRTRIEENEFEHDIEDLIEREDMVITVTQNGYIKRVPLDSFRAQRRGGKGKSAMSTRDEDMTTEVFMANTHTPVLFFSSNGKVYQLKTYKLPLGTAQSKGKALVNIFPLENGETIQSFMPLPEDEKAWEEMNIMFATSRGSVRRNDLSDFKNIRSNGKIAIDMDEGETLVNVRVCAPEQHILLSARSGKCIRFPVEAIRVFKSRKSTGVRGIRLKEGDEVVSVSILDEGGYTREQREAYLKAAPWKFDEGEEVPDVEISSELITEMAMKEQFILSITENGYGKRSSSYEYRTTNRGGSGITNISTSERNGGVVASWPIESDGQIMLMTDGGKLIRCPVKNIRVAGRNTQGVTIFKTAKDETVVSAIRLNVSEEEEELEEGSETAESATEETTAAVETTEATSEENNGE